MDKFIFSATISGSKAWLSPTPVVWTIGGYTLGAYLTAFSGKYMANYSGSTIAQAGIAFEYHSPNYIYNLTLPNNSILSSGSDVSYSTTVYDYHT